MAWLNGWDYRKKITIQGQSGAGTDYQVLLKVGESSGASGCDFHVEGHSANFPSDKNQSGDLRFTKSDGTTLLKFWVEKVEGTSPNRVAYCWVKIADNLDNNVDIYCYYGNSDATNISNGDDTFLLFDDFNGSNLDTNKWNELNSGPLSFSNSIMSIKSDTENTSHDIYSKDTFSYGHCLRGRVAIKQKTCFALENSNHTEGVLEWYDVNDNWNFGVRTGGSLNFDSLGNADIGAWHVDEIIYKSGEGKLRRDGVDKATKTSGVPTVALPANSRSWSSTNEIQVDWIAVRKYISPEPSFSLVGNEERGQNYDLDILFISVREKEGLITLSPIYNYFKKRGYHTKKEHIIIEGIPVQFIPAYNELVKEAVENSVETKYKKTKTKIFKPEYLIAIMLQTFRPKDRERIIKLLDEAKIDMKYLMKILHRYGLIEKFERFMRLYYE